MVDDIQNGIIRNEERFTSPRCDLCNHESRDAIEEMILSGLYTQRAISEKYGITEASISRHKNMHMLSDVKSNLRMLVFEKIMKGKVKDSSIGDVIRALEYLEPPQCEKCEYKQEYEKEKAKPTAHELFDMIIGNDEDHIYISIEEYKKLKGENNGKN